MHGNKRHAEKSCRNKSKTLYIKMDNVVIRAFSPSPSQTHELLVHIQKTKSLCLLAPRIVMFAKRTTVMRDFVGPCSCRICFIKIYHDEIKLISDTDQ